MIDIIQESKTSFSDTIRFSPTRGKLLEDIDRQKIYARNLTLRLVGLFLCLLVLLEVFMLRELMGLIQNPK